MIVKKKKSGEFFLEAQSDKENDAINVIVEMIFDLAEMGYIADDVANRHGHFMRKGKPFNCATIPCTKYIRLSEMQ